MKRFVSILLLIMMAFALCSLSAALAEHVTESDLIGAWQFVGGGELMGYGFRLNADGTGQWLESEDMEHCPPKHLHETGDGFTWQLDGDSFICWDSQGTVTRYTLEQADFRILFTEEEAGGFYARFDEEAIRAEIEDRMDRGEMTEFDALVMDYLNDTLEPTLAERLNLRDVNARVDWYSEEKSVIVEAWQMDKRRRDRHEPDGACVLQDRVHCPGKRAGRAGRAADAHRRCDSIRQGTAAR